ncbi:Serine/threonine protein phosphatase 7 long form isogeny [Arachis hypogaea]|nr:Serine/threonine protein phosphatase 7 long form isogeny [Arachis hypogaea]
MTRQLRRGYLVYSVNEIDPYLIYTFSTIFESDTVMARQAENDGDINRLNETSHYTRTDDFERPHLLLPRRVSHTLPPPDAIIVYLAEAEFGDTVLLRDFTFDNFLISALVERWRPETHMFHLPWGEVTITLQNVAYHLGLHAHGNPVRGFLRDFGRWYNMEKWDMVEQLLGARPSAASQRKESFTLKLVWLHKSNNLVHVWWLPLLRDFAECMALSWVSTVLAWTYQSLYLVAQRGVTDIAGCTPLLMSWIYQRFPQWCPPYRGVYQYPLAARLVGLQQQSRDQHQAKVLYYRVSIDRLRFDEFAWRVYDDPAMQAIPVPTLFNGEQPVPGIPVNLDRYVTTTGRGEDFWWPERLQQWYDGWRQRFELGRKIIVHYSFDTRPTGEYYDWWRGACRVRHLSGQEVLEDPRLVREDTRQPAKRERGHRECQPSDPVRRERARQRWARSDADSKDEAEFDCHEDDGDVPVHGVSPLIAPTLPPPPPPSGHGAWHSSGSVDNGLGQTGIYHHPVGMREVHPRPSRRRTSSLMRFFLTTLSDTRCRPPSRIDITRIWLLIWDGPSARQLVRDTPLPRPWDVPDPVIASAVSSSDAAGSTSHGPRSSTSSTSATGLAFPMWHWAQASLPGSTPEIVFQGLPETVGRSRMRSSVLVGADVSDLWVVAGATASNLLDLLVMLILRHRRVQRTPMLKLARSSYLQGNRPYLYRLGLPLDLGCVPLFGPLLGFPSDLAEIFEKRSDSPDLKRSVDLSFKHPGSDSSTQGMNSAPARA